MSVNIEKMRLEMQYESRKFAVQLLIGVAAAVGAGAAIGNYFATHSPPPAPQIIYVPVPTPAPVKN